MFLHIICKVEGMAKLVLIFEVAELEQSNN